MKLLNLLCGMLLVSALGCATTEKYEAKVQSFFGADVSLLIEKWGYPSQTTVAPSGNKLLIYSNSRSVVIPQYDFTNTPDETATYKYNSFTRTVEEQRYRKPAQAPTVMNLGCTTYFEVSESNTIVRYSFEGNDCTSN